MAEAPMTVVETAEFLKRTARLMSDSEREALVAFVGANPEAGEILPGAVTPRGARSHEQTWRARVIYHIERLPVFLLTARPKNRKANLSKAERNVMKRLLPILVAGYPGKK